MFTKEQNEIFDQVINARRTCRAFSDQAPSREDVEAVVESGRRAPYASVSARDVEVFRHFYVLFGDNPLLPQIDTLIRSQSQADLDNLLAKKDSDPILAEYSHGVERLWGRAAEHGLPGFASTPCLIVMAEWRGARRAERESLSHALQNMLLKATALNLGAKPVSILQSMDYNEEFCKLFNLPVGQYGFLGCALGHRKNDAPPSPPLKSETHWL